MIYRHLLKNISINQVTLLSDINKEFFINKSNKSNYFKIRNFELEYFFDFIDGLDSNILYTVIPFISIKGDPNEPYLVLSRSILATRYSDYKIIKHYIYSKYLKSLEEFGIDTLDDYLLVFKYKKVEFDVNQLNKKFGRNL